MSHVFLPHLLIAGPGLDPGVVKKATEPLLLQTLHARWRRQKIIQNTSDTEIMRDAGRVMERLLVEHHLQNVRRTCPGH